MMMIGIWRSVRDDSFTSNPRHDDNRATPVCLGKKGEGRENPELNVAGLRVNRYKIQYTVDTAPADAHQAGRSPG